MKVHYAAAFFILVLTATLGYEVKADWEQTFGGSWHDAGNSIQQTRDGGYIITGYTTYSSGSSDVYLVKTDASGSMLWQKTLGGTNHDYGHSVQQTSDGGYIVTGYTRSFGAGSYDVYLVKTDASGNMLWQKTFGGTDDDHGYSVQQTSDGGYIIAGYTYSPGFADVYLVKADASGNMLWQKTLGGTNGDYGYAVQQTSDGGYIVTGHTRSFGAGHDDVYLVKTDVSGNMLWQKTFGGIFSDYAWSVQQTSDGGYIIAGTTGGDTNIPDAYLVRADASGNMLWQKTFGGTDDDYGYSVQQTSDGGYITAGFTGSFGAGHYDVYLVKTDVSGNMLWQKTFGGTSEDRGHSVQQTSDGGYIIVGFTDSFGAGEDDVYLVKVDAITTYHAVICGVSDYPGTDSDLRFCDDDARDLREALLRYPNWEETNIQMLLDNNATKANIQAAIATVGINADAGDVCLFFFSGHGTNNTDVSPIDEGDGRDEYLCAYGSSIGEFIRDDELSQWLGTLPTSNVVVAVDTCFSGGNINLSNGQVKCLPGTPDHRVVRGDGFAADFLQRPHPQDMDDNAGCVVLTACDEDELSTELLLLRNGVFSYFAVGALQKNADTNDDDMLSAEEVSAYATPRVNLLSFLLRLDQHPQLHDDYPSGAPTTSELALGLGVPVGAISRQHDDTVLSGVDVPSADAMPAATVYANYPSPLNPDTWIPYELSQAANVTIRIHDIGGRLVRVLNLGHRPAGYYLGKGKAAYWDGKNGLGQRVASGTYFYTLQAGKFTVTSKMAIVK